MVVVVVVVLIAAAAEQQQHRASLMENGIAPHNVEITRNVVAYYPHANTVSKIVQWLCLIATGDSND